MRDILDALEGIHTNKKKPLNMAKELNKKPAVMKALSLEDADVEEGVNDVDKILQLTNELYNELVDFHNEETDENVEDLVGHLAEFKAKLEGDTGSFSEDKFDGYKIHRLGELQKKVDDVAKDIRLLGKTDSMPGATGAGDLTDQLTTMNDAIQMLQDVVERANSIVPDPLKNYDGTPKTEESVNEGGGRDMDCATCDGDGKDGDEDCKVCKGTGEAQPTEESVEENLEMKSEEQNMETTQKDTVEVAVEDLARVLELAGLGKEVISAEAQAEEAQVEAPVEATSEVELDEYSNSPDEDYFDADTQLNKMSGGLNGPKKQFKKEYPGDNPLAVDLQDKLAKMLSDM
jgi:hypothetical protein